MSFPLFDYHAPTSAQSWGSSRGRKTVEFSPIQRCQGQGISNRQYLKISIEKLFLNDWSSGHLPGDKKFIFKGTLVFAPTVCLSNSDKYTPCYEHDLEAAVKSLYVLQNSPIFYSQFTTFHDYKDNVRIQAFWDDQFYCFSFCLIFIIFIHILTVALKPSFWAKLLKAAREKKYETLIDQAAKVLVSNQ